MLSDFTIRSGRSKIYFGPKSTEALRDWLSRFRRVFIVTGRKSAKVSGALNDVLRFAEELGLKYEVFSEVFPNPTAKLVDDVAFRVWRFGAEAVIAIGGGSPIDTAKLASVIAVCGGKAEEYIRGDKVACNSLPLAAINLTHGTGTEADRYAVATIEETHDNHLVIRDIISLQSLLLACIVTDSEVAILDSISDFLCIFINRFATAIQKQKKSHKY